MSELPSDTNQDFDESTTESARGHAGRKSLQQHRVIQDEHLTELSRVALETGSRHRAFDDHYAHWRLHQDNEDVLWVLLDKANASTNTLSHEVLSEFNAILEFAESHKPAAMVIRSVKANGFLYGAEISEFRGITDQQAILAQVHQGHEILNRLEKLPLTTIALLHGQCLGGGLELALACDIRIARNDTKLGFPEVQLGIHPGLGGTARLTRIVSPAQAMTLMLTGKSISAKKARSLGLVDATGEERHFAKAVRSAVKGKLPARAPSLSIKLQHNFLARRLIAYQSLKKTGSKVKQEHYPAPFRLIDLWQEHGSSTTELLKAEPESFSELLASATAQNLIRVFFLRERLRKKAKASADVKRIKHVHVIGAGTMGGDIGAWCAWQGMQVTLEDMKPELLEPALKRAHSLFDYKSKSRGPIAKTQAWDRLIPDLNGVGRRRADLVIEAIPEQLDLKQKLYKELEPVIKSSAILATNTSSLQLDKLAESLRHPERLVGMHFFNPVQRMQLIEIVTHERLSDEVLQAAMTFAGDIDRLPIAVRSAPGFLVNRALTPYLLEALVLLDEGVVAAKIDAAAEEFGMPMGPVELADQIGLDICLNVAQSLKQNLSEPQADIPEWFRDKVNRGDTGKKSGKGLYDYKDGKPQKEKNAGGIDPELQDRLLLPLLNTCMKCLNDGIVANTDDLDAAMVFATGFAPFRGGPMHYARQRGYQDIAARLSALAARHGPRFKPAEGWSDAVKAAEAAEKDN